MRVVGAKFLAAVAIALLCSTSSIAADEVTEVGSYKKYKPDSLSYPVVEPGTVIDLIRQYRLDPDFVHCGGPLHVKLPEGRIFIRQTLLSFGPEPFPMAVELTSRLLPSNPHLINWTVTGPGWDRLHRGWTTEAGDPLKSRLTSLEGHWIIRHAKPDGVFDRVSTSAGFGWKLELDEQGGIAAVEDTEGRRVEYAKRPNGSLKSVTGPDEEQWTFGYNDRNQLVQITGRHNGYSAKVEYYPNGRVEAVEGPERLEFDYKDHQNHLAVDLFGRTRSANVYRFAKDGRATTVGVFGGPRVTCRYDSSGTLVEVQDSYGRRESGDASHASMKGLHEAFTDAVIEIREHGISEFLDRRFERAGNRLSESVSETVRTVTDAATGNANQALDASAEELGDLQPRRQQAFVRIQRWIREAVHPAVLPIYEAVEIASNPDDRQRLQGLANWIESEANSVLETFATQAQSATRDDVVLRVRERIREPVYDRMQNLPPRLQQMIRGSLEWVVGQAVDGGIALGGRTISGNNTEADGQTPSGGRTSPDGQTPPETRPPESTDPPRAVAVTTEDIKRALRKSLQRMGVQPRYLYGPEVFRSPSFLIVGPEEVFLHDKATTEYRISLRRLASSDQAKRCLDEWTVKPPTDGNPPHLKYVIRERSREVKAVIRVSRLDRPATKHLPESWSHGSCSYAWLLDDRTFVVFDLNLWPARGRVQRPPRASEMGRRPPQATPAASRPSTRPPWSNWTKDDYLSRTRPILVTIMRVLEEELGVGVRET